MPKFQWQFAICFWCEHGIKQSYLPHSFIQATDEVMKETYSATHARTSPWFVGLLFGYYMHNTRNQRVQLSKLWVLLGWVCSLGIISTLLFSFYPEAKNNSDTTTLQEAFYWSLGRLAWPMVLCWLIFACVNGYAGAINSFLSQPLWQPLAKLSYSIYIYHMVLVAFNAGRTKVNIYFSTYDMTLNFWGNFSWSVLLATAMYIAFEAPLLNLQKLLLPKKKPAAAVTTVSKEKLFDVQKHTKEIVAYVSNDNSNAA